RSRPPCAAPGGSARRSPIRTRRRAVSALPPPLLHAPQPRNRPAADIRKRPFARNLESSAGGAGAASAPPAQANTPAPDKETARAPARTERRQRAPPGLITGATRVPLPC